MNIMDKAMASVDMQLPEQPATLSVSTDKTDRLMTNLLKNQLEHRNASLRLFIKHSSINGPLKANVFSSPITPVAMTGLDHTLAGPPGRTAALLHGNPISRFRIRWGHASGLR